MSPLQKGILGFSIYVNSRNESYLNTNVYKIQFKY